MASGGRGWLAQATAPLLEAPFTHEVVLAAQQLPLPHRDPDDRFLASLREQRFKFHFSPFAVAPEEVLFITKDLLASFSQYEPFASASIVIRYIVIRHSFW